MTTYCPECDGSVAENAERCPACRKPRPSEGWPEDELLGKPFAEAYTVVRRLGSGGFGVVYLATNNELGGKRAVKVLHKRYVHNDAILARFKREAKALYRLQSPYVVRMERWGRTPAGDHFLVMEFAAGETLRTMLKRKQRLDEERAVRIVRQTAIALADAHSIDVLHRDLKPANIMVIWLPSGKFQIKILDFGLAALAEEAQGGLQGSIYFMAPEQFEKKPPDKRSDLYSLGLLTVEVCSGAHPYAGRSAEEVRDKSMAGYIPSDFLKTVPDPIRPLIETMLRTDPAERIVDLGVLYDRIISHLHAKYDYAGARMLAAFVEDVGDIELSTSIVYSGMIGTSVGEAFASDPGMGRVPEKSSASLWADIPTSAGPPSVELPPMPLPQQHALALSPEGRAELLDSLVVTARGAQNNSPRCVLVSGPRGIGKTYFLRLAEERLQEEGFQTALLTVGADCNSRPFGGLFDLMGLLLGGAPMCTLSNPGDSLEKALSARSLGRPEEIRSLLNAVTLPSEAPAEVISLRRAAESILRELINQATAPVALLVDGLERIDVLSLETIRSVLSQNQGTGRLFVAATSTSKGLLNQLSRAIPEDQRSTIVLPFLADSVIEAMGQTLSGAPLQTRWTELSAGSPTTAT
ncbi:MAG: serine/threonine-protein kinase PknK, partial [Myxococcales bacterium]|nr:serine/threonine-protein kinase PknK [Myxococcales bacterium]